MEKRIEFYSGPGLKIAGSMETPHTGEKKERVPGIVLCHGPGAVKEHLMPEVSDVLVAAGYGVLRFDYRGFGESEGAKNRLIPLEQCEDIMSAVTYLRQQPGIDPDRIGLWGTATGGANAVCVAGTDVRVKCMVSVNSAGDLGRWLRGGKRYWEWVALMKKVDEDSRQRAMTGTPLMVETHEIFSGDPAAQDFFKRVREQHPELKVKKRELAIESVGAMISFRPEAFVNRITPRAAMWICASEDTMVPVDESRGMYELADSPKRLVIIEGLKHHDLYLDRGFDLMMAESVKWFDTWLTADPEQTEEDVGQNKKAVTVYEETDTR